MKSKRLSVRSISSVLCGALPLKCANPTVAPARRPWSAIIRQGQVLRIIDSESQQAVDTLFYSAADSGEGRLGVVHSPDEVLAARTLSASNGMVPRC